jgi:hypothetical protein
MSDMREWVNKLVEGGPKALKPANTEDPGDIDRWNREYYWARDFAKADAARKKLAEVEEKEKQDQEKGTFNWDDLDLRMAVINMGYNEIPGFEFLEDLARDDLTDLCIQRLSLCPIHRVDWAICFDDQPADCAQIRYIYPCSHDT